MKVKSQQKFKSYKLEICVNDKFKFKKLKKNLVLCFFNALTYLFLKVEKRYIIKK